jgi:HAD superfamily hydrolase (TIGR01509 family)
MTDFSSYAFLFDMDGVICDNNSFHRQSWLEYAHRLGKVLTEDDIITKVYGKTNAQILQYVLGREVESEELEFHTETKEALFRDMYRPHFQLTPGLEAFLSRAKELGIRLGLGTNAPLSNLTFSWEMGRLDRFFEVAAHPALVDKPKPAPDLYLHVASQLGISPIRAIVFEDSKTGIAAARAAGAEVVAISSTYPVEELEVLSRLVTKDFTTILPEQCITLVAQGVED